MTKTSNEEVLRLAFGTAATTTSTQWYAIESVNGGNPGLLQRDGRPRFLAFEAKGRIQRPVSMTTAVERVDDKPSEVAAAWNGNVQVCDQTDHSAHLSPSNPGLWNWDVFSDANLCEIDEFRPYMALHNHFQGQSVAMDGSLTLGTMDTIEDKVRSVLEACDNLRFVQALVDMDSAWGGLARSVLTYLNEECPSAVVAVFGNDWSYPLPDQQVENLYSADPASRDRSKIAARRAINLAASMTSLTECASIMLPIAMTPPSRRYDTSQGASCGHVAFVAAAAMEVAMAPFHTVSASQLLEGIVPSKKIMELAARVPLLDDPTLLLDDATACSDTQMERWNHSSLLPQWKPALGTSTSSSSLHQRPRFRRIHLRGPFAEATTALSDVIERFQTQDVVVDWSSAPLMLPASTRTSTDTDGTWTEATVEAAAQLSLSTHVGGYLEHLATTLPTHKSGRILYEFCQSGMNVDALTELYTHLHQSRDQYY